MEVTLQELVAAVAAMRAAQKAYFKTRDPAMIQPAKHMEYAVDKLIDAIVNPPAPNLFPNN